MKKIEIFFGNSENTKQKITNLFKKIFPNNSINYITAKENIFTDEDSYYGCVEIGEDQEDKFQSFFSEYIKAIKIN